MSEYIVSGVPYIAQTTYETCWLAAYKMMLAYKGKSQQLAEQLPNHKEMRVNGIMDSQLLGCRKALELSSSSYTGYKDPESVGWKLRNYGPLWVSGKFAKGHKHIIVVYGIREPLFGEPELLIHDPQTGMSITNVKPEWIAHSWFANRLNPVPYACQHWGD